MSDTIAKLRDLLLNSSKAGRLRGLLDSIYGAASTGAEAYGAASSPMSAEHSGLLGGLLMDMSPLGDAKSAYDGVQSAREGDWLGAGLGGLGALPMVPNLAGVTMYRGIHGKYDPNFKQNIEWFSKEKNLAEEYGPNVIQKDINPKNPASLGFRTYGTEIKFDDVLDRIGRAITDRFQSNQLPKDSALKLIDEVESLRGGKDYKKVHQWLMESPQAANLLKGAGYDSIEHIERGVPTYGVLK